MKIKFIKDYRAIPVSGGMENDFGAAKGEVMTVREDAAKWLIDNGFAKEAKESSAWKPKFDEKYYFLGNTGKVCVEPWLNDELDEYRYSMGECFKTEKAAEAWRDYRTARVTVSRDEGVLTLKQIRDVFIKHYRWVFIIINDIVRCRKYVADARLIRPGDVCFDTKEHAQASLDKHPDEWKIIANYDWSKE